MATQMAKIQIAQKTPSQVEWGGDIGLEERMIIFLIPTVYSYLLFLVSLNNLLEIGWGLQDVKLGCKPTLVELQKESEQEKPYK